MKQFIISESEKNRIIGMHRMATSKFFLLESNFNDNIYWQSCDGEMNLLTNESKEMLQDAGEENGKKLYYFSEQPTEKAKNPKYDISGCLGVKKCESPENCETKVFIEKYNGQKVLRLYEGF